MPDLLAFTPRPDRSIGLRHLPLILLGSHPLPDHFPNSDIMNRRLDMLLVKFLERHLKCGTIVLIAPNGRSACIKKSETPQITIRLKTWWVLPKLLLAVNYFLA